METHNKQKVTKNQNLEFAKIYYVHQYERVSKLEEQGIAITNIVITLSVLSFTFGFSNTQNTTLLMGLLLPFTVVIANGFAIAHVLTTSYWLQFHRYRGLRILELYAPVIHKVDKEIIEERKVHFLGRRRIQLLIHALLIITALVPTVLFLFKLQ